MLVATKRHANSAVAAAVAAHAPPGVALLLLQNGLDASEDFSGDSPAGGRGLEAAALKNLAFQCIVTLNVVSGGGGEGGGFIFTKCGPAAALTVDGGVEAAAPGTVALLRRAGFNTTAK